MKGHLDDPVAQLGRLLFGFLIAHEFDSDHQALAANVADDFVLRLRQSAVCFMMNSPMRAALAMYFSSSKPIVASEAAMQTGLPPNVEACAPGFQSITLPRAIIALSGMPDAIPFAVQMISGSIPACSDSPPFAGAAHAGLHFVRDEQYSVFAADALQALQEFRRRRQIAAFALNRLDEDSGDFFGIDAAAEQFVFEIAQSNLPTRASGRTPYVPRYVSGYGA